MPIYSYVCPCNKEFDELLSMEERNKEVKCECGEVASKKISDVHLSGMYHLGRSKPKE